MSEIENTENSSVDTRWIALRVSRIDLCVTLVFAAISILLLLFVGGVPAWIRFVLLAALALSLFFDVWLTLQKGRYSVAAFYLIDLDSETPPVAKNSSDSRSTPAPHAPKLGIRVRFVNGARHLHAERDGVVMRATFVSPWFTALRYQLAGDVAWRRWWPRMIALWPDNLNADAFRKVRVALKWK